MAQPPNPPVKPPPPTSRHNPLHGALRAEPEAPLTGAHVAAEATSLEPPPVRQVNMHGIPPMPNMAPTVVPPTEAMNEATEAEMAAGKEALKLWGQRANAEHEYGQKAVARHGRVTPVSDKNDKEE